MSLFYLLLIFPYYHAFTEKTKNKNDKFINILLAKNETLSISHLKHIFLCHQASEENLMYSFWSTLKFSIFSTTPYTVSLTTRNDTQFFYSRILSYLKSYFGLNSYTGFSNHYISPSTSFCIKINFEQPVDSVNYNTQIIYIDSFLVLYFLIGVCMLKFSSKIIRYQLFYYVTGCVFSCFFFLFVGCFFVFKIFYSDLKSSIFSLTIVGTISAIISNFYYTALKHFFFSHYELLFAYVVIISILTSILIYLFGPVSNPRIRNVVKWSVQASGLFLVYASTRTLIGALLLISLSLLACGKDIIPKFLPKTNFPQETPMLSLEEYDKQGRVETRMAIDDLREQLRVDARVAASILNKSQNKETIRKFIEGSDHIPLSEALSYHEEYSCDSDSDDTMMYASDDSVGPDSPSSLRKVDLLFTDDSSSHEL